MLVTGALAAIPAMQAAAQELPPPADHLLLTEVVVSPTGGEFVEIHNPTSATIELSDVYLTDATFAGGPTYYYQIVTGGGGGGGFADFNSRFPDGASIAAGAYQTVAFAGSDAFFAEYGVDPTYELFEDGSSADSIPDMREAVTGSVNNQGGLSNNGEVVILYHWDGASDLVGDLDYFVYGDAAEAVDKTGVSIDGPDAGAGTSTYLPDTAIAIQESFSPSDPHGPGESAQRRDLSEGDETKTGGNGVTGNDESSENLPDTWGVAAPNPGLPTTLPPPDPGPGEEPEPFPAPGSCGDAFTPIYEIQGDDEESPLYFDGAEKAVITEGVITDVLFDGFSIQDPVGDGDDGTSDGVWVDASPGTNVVGDAVRVVGHVEEFFGLTQIGSAAAEDVIVIGCGAGAAITPTTVTLPLPFGVEFEDYEGMIVHFSEMTVTDVFSLSRFGEVQLSAPDRLRIPTDIVLPGAQADQLNTQNGRAQIVMDDRSTSQNPTPVPFVGADGTLRLGETTTDLVGLVTCNFGCPKLEPMGDVVFSGNPRMAAPDDVGGDIKVGSFNVLNYFTTIDDGVNQARGADSAVELERQTQKLVAAIDALGADVISLQELENNGPTAIGALVAALGDPWAAVADPAYPGGLESTNEIKVGIIYNSDRVSPVGASEVSEDVDFSLDRPPIAQTFDADGEVFTVIANHFKSKSCTDTGPGEPFPEEADSGDGQACFNPRRTRMAAALLEFVAEMQTLSGDDDVIAIGDFNSYAQEDPIRALVEGGLVDLTSTLATADRYSLVFFGQAGQLDFAFATPELAAKVTGVDIWGINADEPPFLDYNTEFKPPGSFSPDVYRSSDHDPLVVGIGDAAAPAPRQAILGIADALAGDVAGARGADKQRLRHAVDALAAAGAADDWVDDDHAAGKSVFLNLKKAVSWLSSVARTDVGDALDSLTAAARELAAGQVDIAVHTDAHGGKTALAQAELAAGDAAGSHNAAVRHYRKAWLHASKALELVASFGTYNLSLNRFSEGQLAANLATTADPQAQTVAEIMQRTRPAAILLNEFDFDEAGISAGLFQENYLSISQGGAAPISYPYVYVAPSNTGVPSGLDLNNNGTVGGPDDAFGFGFFEGQFGMVVMSMYPIHYDEVRTFQNFLWKDMPGALLPDDPATAAPADWYSAEELAVFRLSSKSHWDVPVQVGTRTVHFLVSHPTPPVFDGPEDRNGTRNHDEIRFWADYIDPAASGYVYDDAGGTGGLAAGASFVIAGDQNSDPLDGDSIPGSAQLLLDSPLVNTAMTPSSLGAVEAAAVQGGANDSHLSDPKFDTADFSDSAPGNLRADYVLPSADTRMRMAQVFWPVSTDPLFPLVGNFPFPSSDHKLVYVRIALG